MKMKLIEVQEFKASNRWTIQRGSTVKFGGGGLEYVTDGEKHRMRMAGTYRVRRIYQAKVRGRSSFRVFLEVRGDRGTFTVFVHGPAYRSEAGPMSRPYRVRRARKSQRTAKSAR